MDCSFSTSLIYFGKGSAFNLKAGLFSQREMAREFSKSFYNSKEWKAVRDYCMKRDKYLCVRCGEPAEEVHHVEHLTPKNIYDPKIALNPENLKSLCRACHFEQHRGEHANGLKRKEKEAQWEYEFDSNGFLVRKEKI